MSFVKVRIHAVWGTKNREHFLTKEIRTKVVAHLKENARKKHIHIIALNGYTDHMHALFYLNANMTIAKAIQLMKGESAYWINKYHITKSKFQWADEYYAASLSESAVKTVSAYIDNQEEYHSKRSFSDAAKYFLDEYTGGQG